MLLMLYKILLKTVHKHKPTNKNLPFAGCLWKILKIIKNTHVLDQLWPGDDWPLLGDEQDVDVIVYLG